MAFKPIISNIRRKLPWNKNLIPYKSQTSRSNQSLDLYKDWIEYIGIMPSLKIFKQIRNCLT
jgi:hypothetical protein